MSASINDDFYVGYLAIPRSHKRFLQVLIPLFALSLLSLAALVAFSQRDPGNGVWNIGKLQEWVGVIETQPYPYLITTDEDGNTLSLLLVEMGKLGGGQRAEEYAGQVVRVRGFQLVRDGREMIELNLAGAEEPAIELLNEPLNLRRTEPKLLNESVQLRGEIVDTKCFLGAMKPGDGHTHRACARLCIAGGIPPTLVTPPIDGKRQYFLLADSQGQAVGQKLLGYVADPVEITGRLWQRDGLQILYLDPAAIRRIGG